MIKEIELFVEARAKILVDVPDYLLKTLDDSDYLKRYLSKEHPRFSEKKLDLYNLISNKLTLENLGWDELEVLDVIDHNDNNV